MKRKPGLKCPKLEATVIKAEAHQDGSAVHASQVSWPKLKPRLKKEKKKKRSEGGGISWAAVATHRCAAEH